MALRHYPFALAWWMATKNALSQKRRVHFLAAIGVGTVAVVILLFARGRWANDGLNGIGEYEAWIAVLAATHAMFWIAHRRRLSMLELKQSWLAATQLGAATLQLSIFLRTVWTLAIQLLSAIGAILFAVAIQAATPQIAGRLVLLISVGALVGGACGWIVGRPRPPPSRLSMRFTQASSLRPRSTSIRASIVGLSKWPIAQVLFWSSPKALRWPFIVAAMSVPMGSSAGLGIVIVGSWALLLYMISILTATMRGAREAGRWLYPTPMRFAPFALALIGRAFVHQLVASAVLAAILTFPADRPGTRQSTASLFLIWIVLATTASTIAVAESYRMSDSGIPVAIAIASLVATTAYAPPLLGPIALVWTGIYCWRGARRV